MNKTYKDDEALVFGSPEMREPAPSEYIPKHKTPADIAYQLVKDETFPQTVCSKVNFPHFRLEKGTT